MKSMILYTSILIGTAIVGYKSLRYLFKRPQNLNEFYKLSVALSKKINEKWPLAIKPPCSVIQYPVIAERHKQGNINFEIKVRVPLKIKIEEKPEYGVQKSNPFLPPFDPNIFISQINQTHRLLFNKYCLAKKHLLIVTKLCENQILPLTVDDFQSLLVVLHSVKGFAYYNSGQNAGASQAHKHLQVIPYQSMKLTNNQLPISLYIEEVISQIERGNQQILFQGGEPQRELDNINLNLVESQYSGQKAKQEKEKIDDQFDKQVNMLPVWQGNQKENNYQRLRVNVKLRPKYFKLNFLGNISHLCVYFGEDLIQNLEQNLNIYDQSNICTMNLSSKLLQIYQDLLSQIGNKNGRSYNYNLIVTSRWMLIVNRLKEKGRLNNGKQIGVNSMGFGGSLYARDKEQAESIKATGFVEILRDVSILNQ